MFLPGETWLTEKGFVVSSKGYYIADCRMGYLPPEEIPPEDVADKRAEVISQLPEIKSLLKNLDIHLENFYLCDLALDFNEETKEITSGELTYKKDLSDHLQAKIRRLLDVFNNA